MATTKVRFAPSPTGVLHLGSARTALVNWLYARHTGGEFLLRIEDTDQVRSKAEHLDEILEDLAWMGLDWDGDYLKQSTRFDIYKETAKKLLDEGKAYAEGDAIIFKVEKGKEIILNDLIHGKITFNTDEIKDQVMIKSDGSPAYNFCCVVDDAYQEVTHIIRGDDHISNTPKQMLFYEALGKPLPEFAHMPLMMGADGSKLSKRHGAVAVEEYKKEGFLPEALANYLMLLGWSPEGDKEIFSIQEALKTFDVKDMNDTQVRFDIQKLRWLNGEHIMTKTDEELLPFIKQELAKANIETTDDYLLKLISLFKVRIKTISEFPALTDYFFTDDYTVDEKEQKKHLEKEGNKDNVKIFAEALDKTDDFSHENIEAICRKIIDERELKPAQIIHPTRIAISGKMKGAGLFETMEVLGKEKTIERMKKVSA